MNQNPLLVRKGLPPYDEIRVEHVIPAVEQLLKETEEYISNIEHNIQPTWDQLVEPLELLEHPFEYTWQPITHLTSVKNSDALRKAFESVLQEVVAMDLRVKQSKVIYEGLKLLKNSPEWDRLDSAQKRIIDWRIQSAELSGIALDGKNRERFIAIEKELSQLSTDFSNNILDSTKAYELIIIEKSSTDGWTNSLKALTSQSYNESKSSNDSTPEKGPWRITLDYPIYMPFMKHHKLRGQREEVYKAFITRASSDKWDNTDLMRRILRLKKEKSKLLGYSNYAEISLASKMAPDIKSVHDMIESLKNPSRPHAEQDIKDLLEIAKQMGQTEPLMQWDTSYYSERLREKRFNYSDDELRPYFPMPRVLEGMFSLAEKIFSIQIKKLDNVAPVWHKDVEYFQIEDETGNQIASFYLDPYSRPAEKRGGAWMADCLGRRKINGNTIFPIAHLCCNGTPPVDGKPSLMSFDEVNTLFHEFGHGLQWMLTTIDYFGVSGINGIEWDAVELPSQFMENWCYHKPTLIELTKHIDTGKPLPDELFDKIYSAKNFQSGLMMLRQLKFAKTDMELHSTYDPDGDESPFDVQKKISLDIDVLPPLDEDRFLCSFSHIFAGGYSAGYYSYKWAEVLSADAFSAFEEVGLDNEIKLKEVGKRYRNTILALGGSMKPMDVFKLFRGREPETKALLRHSGLS